MTAHEHGKLMHTHAYGDIAHHHMLRAICQRPECIDHPTHNMHTHAQGVPKKDGDR